MIALPFGVLPTAGFLAIHAKLSHSEARAALDAMRRSLANFGASNALREMLRAYDFEWRETTVSDLDLDVAAVAAALGDER